MKINLFFWKNSKFLIYLLIALGIIATFCRESLIAYFYGSSKDVALFKIAFAMPYSFFQTLGTILVGGLLPFVLYDKRNQMNLIKIEVKKVFLFLCLVMLMTSSIQARILAPGFSESEIYLLTNNLRLCYFFSLVSSFILIDRLLLQKNDKNNLIAATSLLFAIFFCLLLSITTYFGISYKLSLSAIIAILLIAIIYRLSAKSYDIKKSDEDIDRKYVSRKQIRKIIIGSCCYVLLLALPRMIDRAVASKMSISVVSNYDYAMNLYSTIGILIGTTSIIFHTKKISIQRHANSVDLTWLIRIIIVLGCLSMVLVIFSNMFISSIFSCFYLHGNFNLNDLESVITIYRSLSISLPAMISNMLLIQVLISYSINYAIFIGLIKISVKLFLAEALLTSYYWFGISTMVMETLGLIISFCIVFLTYQYRIKKDEPLCN